MWNRRAILKTCSMNLAFQDIVQYGHQLFTDEGKIIVNIRNSFYYDYAEIC